MGVKWTHFLKVFIVSIIALSLATLLLEINRKVSSRSITDLELWLLSAYSFSFIVLLIFVFVMFPGKDKGAFAHPTQVLEGEGFVPPLPDAPLG